MYNEYFGFIDAPFTTTPSSRFFYTNGIYREALANLRYGIEWRKGLIVMTGEVGTGKTTLLCKTMHNLQSTVHPIFVSYDQLTSRELLRVILRELRIPYDAHDRVAALDRLRSHLVRQHRKAHIVALLIDEAQNLSDQMFEDIRFLSNFETEDHKLLQIVLTGQPELDARLDGVHLRHIKQRVVLHCRLEPLGAGEVGPYIDARLQAAGYKGDKLFDTETVNLIAVYSAGIPRLINIICDNALLVAYAQSAVGVSVEVVQEVARDLRLQGVPPKPGAVTPLSGRPGAVATTPTSTRHAVQGGAAVTRRQTSRFGLVTTRVSLILITIGTSGGAFYSWPISGYFNHAAPLETPAVPAARVNPVTLQPSEADPHAREPHAPKPQEPKAMKSEVRIPPNNGATRPLALGTRKNGEGGRFTVAGATSFLRARPHAASRILATLAPGAEVTILGKNGTYFKVQTSVNGRRLRGYVHREDAFFERNKKNGRGGRR